MNVDALVTYYRKASLRTSIRIPPNCIVIGLEGPVMEVSLDCGGEGEPRVVFTEAASIYQPSAESLEKLLFRTAFLIYRPAHLGRQVMVQAGMDSRAPKLLKPASELAESLGFQRQWFSDSVAFCGEKRDAHIYIRQTEDSTLEIRLLVEIPATLSLLRLLFLEKFEARITHVG